MCIGDYSIVESSGNISVIDSDIMSAGEIGFVQGYFDRGNRVFAVVAVGSKIKYCPITGLQVL